MAGFKWYRQLDMMDCGPTCLKMIAAHYGKSISINKLREYASFAIDGVSLLGIAEAAERVGFKCVGTKITYEQLIREARLPCIIHWGQNHFVVVTPKVSNRYIVVADPEAGIRKVPRAFFESKWLAGEEGNERTGIALLLEPTIEFYQQENDKDDRIGWGILYKYLWNYKRYLFQLMLSVFVTSLLQLIFPFLTQSIVDTGINTHNLHFIYIIAIAQFVLLASRTLVEFIRSRLLLFVSTHINVTILSDFWIKLLKLPLNFFDTKQTGDILQRIGDHQRIQQFLTGSTLNTLFSLFNLLIFSVVLLTYYIPVFLIFTAGSVLYFLWIWIFLKYRRRLDYQRFGAASRENSSTMQLIQGMQEIKLNGAGRLFRWEWEGLQAVLFKLGFKGLSLSQIQQSGAIFFNEGKNILITFVVAKAVLDGQLTLGAMLAVQYIIGQLNSPIDQLVGFVQQAQDARISLERLNEIHQLEDEEPDGKQLLHYPASQQPIRISGLSFTYAGAGNEPVLNDIELVIPQGKVTAVVGASGSGKTTLFKLLLRFYEHYQGEIKIGETHLRAISPSYWQHQCASVMQEGYIFSDSIARNIALSEQSPNYDRLIHACKVANILHFIEGMPLGFNTRIGAEGNGISAGQRQRILIARAIYRDPSYLFLDEATNALDANNEKAIMENLQQFFVGRTVVVIAHRLSTVKNADNIIVMHEGMIVETGTHQQLSATKGHYYQLVKNQLELGN
ncbi:peptidase domain-containing ABC transporter [Chitinophaga sp. HK235]|uniref:peptidase domain-containing ABC transporter n=1 Tax=Chitinophaga sp. HK235 TaxID=2952571 RepID=UPI001BA7D5BB|nr:peptidase domain-containing ABC transporter [Chitinophaga sp. HK235]